MAQPNSALESYLLDGNKYFEQGDYAEALMNYKELIAQQPSNIYVIEQMARAEEELLYKEISEGENPEADCIVYINQYGDEGKYIVNVKNILGQRFLAAAYKNYQERDIMALEILYVEYLTLLGAERSGEIKKWLYQLCNEKADASLKVKDWETAKVYFEKCLMYNTSEKEFKSSQNGLARALKKRKK